MFYWDMVSKDCSYCLLSQILLESRSRKRWLTLVIELNIYFSNRFEISSTRLNSVSIKIPDVELDHGNFIQITCFITVSNIHIVHLRDRQKICVNLLLMLTSDFFSTPNITEIWIIFQLGRTHFKMYWKPWRLHWTKKQVCFNYSDWKIMHSKKLRCLFSKKNHKNLINWDRVRRAVVKIICHLCLMNVVIIYLFVTIRSTTCCWVNVST